MPSFDSQVMLLRRPRMSQVVEIRFIGLDTSIEGTRKLARFRDLGRLTTLAGCRDAGPLVSISCVFGGRYLPLPNNTNSSIRIIWDASRMALAPTNPRQIISYANRLLCQPPSLSVFRL
jgi:hypothetical protein